MRNDIQRAIQEVNKIDRDFLPDSVWETESDIILIDDEPGMPPYIVSKKNYSARQLEFGKESDMKTAYVDSVKVEDWRT